MFRSAVLVLCLVLQGCECYQIDRFLQKKVKPLNYFGCVQMKFFDTLDRMTPKVKLKSGIIINVDVYEMFEELQSGDTVIKESGSLKHVLKRNGEIKVFYPKCGGNEIR